MNCIHCNNTGKCHFCGGSGRSGISNCIHCHGTGTCNFCHGQSTSSGPRQPAGFGARGPQQPAGFGARGPQQHPKFGPSGPQQHPKFGPYGPQQQGGFGPRGPRQPTTAGSYGQQPDPIAEGKRLATEAIKLLYSKNPGDRIQGINQLLSQEAFHGRNLAYEPALELYPQETMPDVRRGLLLIISGFSKGKDQRAFDILSGALDEPDSSLLGIVISGLAHFGEKAAPVVPKIRDIYQANPSSGTKRQLINLITEIGPAAESVFDIITNDLASTSWLMRRATLKAVKKLKKKSVNVVGFLVNQLETGDIDQKVAACSGLGALGDDAKGSVMALTKALVDPIPDVRAKAAWALSQMGKNAAPAESALQLAVKDDSPMVSKFALKTLSKLKKLTKEQKEDIKQMEAIEKEVKAWRAKFKDIYPDAPKEKDEEEAPAEISTQEAPEVNDLIFMSHALPDFTWVKKAMDQIETWPGCRVWTCERDIPTGGDWLESIYGGLENCSWYVLFWSDKAQNSKWTNEEMKEAKTRIVSRGRPKITVVNLGKQDWPLLLQRYQGALVTTDEQLSTWLNNLKEQILSGAPAPGEMEQ